MPLKTFHKLALPYLEDAHKVKWLEIQNFGSTRRGEGGFPTVTVSDKDLEQFPHTYWYQAFGEPYHVKIYNIFARVQMVFGLTTVKNTISS